MKVFGEFTKVARNARSKHDTCCIAHLDVLLWYHAIVIRRRRDCQISASMF